MARFIDAPKKENFFEKIWLLKEKFMSLFQHQKKIRAIENFTAGDFFPHKSYLTLIKQCMSDGFLEEKEASFLDHMLTKYEIIYLDWAYKTKWVKQQIMKKAEAMPLDTQEMFEFQKPAVPVAIPLHLMMKGRPMMGKRV